MSHSVSSNITVGKLTAAICGNPNCGKTTIFNALTGLRQKVGNYPGVTVEKITGRFSAGGKDSGSSDSGQSYLLLDTPGCYSLAAFSPDEYVATQALTNDEISTDRPDLLIMVIDATNLERGLYLLFQVLELKIPVVIALNMVDLSHRRGISIDTGELSKMLFNIPVVEVIGSRGKGIDKLKDAVFQVSHEVQDQRESFYDKNINEIVNNLATLDRCERSKVEYLRILFDKSGPAETSYLKSCIESGSENLANERVRIIKEYGSLSAGETNPLTTKASEIAQKVIDEPPIKRTSRSERADRYLLHPILGPLILISLMIFMFQSIFSWSEPVMIFIETVFNNLGGVIEGMMVAGSLRSLLVDGIIGGVGSVLIFLPQIIVLFLFISILEDSGYMPRAAFLVDRLFGWCGLSGKSFVPLLSSFACAVPGVMAARTIENRKLRLITILVAPLMSCSARLPIYTIMIAAFIPHKTYLGFLNLPGLILTLLYLLGLLVAVVVATILSRTFLKGERGTFMMEMPSYNIPSMRSVFIRIINRATIFVTRAGTVILAITIIVWVLSYYPRSDAGLSISSQDSNEQLSGQNLIESNSYDKFNAGERIRHSYLGRIGRGLAPFFKPLGWDWKITVATLASFPAREVVVATLGTIYNLGSEEDETSLSLIEKMQQAKWESGDRMGQPVFTPAVALSIMVFFALCAQCGATLVTIRHETGGMQYAIAAFIYMTTLAYFSAMAAYQLASRLGF